MTSMEQIEQIAIEARAHGMTYGEYVKKFSPQMPRPTHAPLKTQTERIAEPKKCKRRAEIEVVCEACGVKFTARSRIAKYCKECGLERKKASQREYWRQEYAKIREQKNNS